MMFIALTIVACLRMVGIVLVISLLTVPQMTANLFSHRFHRIIWLSIGIGYLSCLGGLMISFYLNVPSGASIIFFSIIIYAICKNGKSFGYICNAKSKDTMEIKIQSLDQIHEAARQFIAEMGDNTVFALYGKWGGQDDFHQSRLRGIGRFRRHHLPYLRHC